MRSPPCQHKIGPLNLHKHGVVSKRGGQHKTCTSVGWSQKMALPKASFTGLYEVKASFTGLYDGYIHRAIYEGFIHRAV